MQRAIARCALAARSRSFLISSTLPAFSVALSISMLFTLGPRPIVPGLDDSFVYAFNYAAERGLRWGRDFVSTHGPYGYLITAVDVGDHARNRVAADLLLAVGSGIAAWLYVQSVSGIRLRARVGLVAALIYVLAYQAYDERWFAPFLLVFLTGLQRPGPGGLIAYTVAGFVAGFYLLIKFSLGFGALITVGLGCVLVRQPAVAAYRFCFALTAAAAGFLIGWKSYGGTLGGIGPYLATAWQVSSGYSSAMSLVPKDWWIGVLSFTVWVALLALWIVVQRNRRNVMSSAGLVFPLFVVWKHGMVRQDGHVSVLVAFGLFVMTILLVDTVAASRWWTSLLVVGVATVPLLFTSVNQYTGGIYALAAVKTWGRASLELPIRGVRELLQLRHFETYRQALARASDDALRKKVLPHSIRAVIGDASVDVYPWEISYVPANRLTWLNRPFPASFSTYTPALDNLNAAFFESRRKPEYILWHTDVGVNSIDGRYLFWDEPGTLRSIVNYYEVVTTDSDVVLLRARAEPRFALPEPLGTVTASWNSWIPVPQTSGVLLAHVSIKRSLVTGLIRAAFREGPVLLSLRFTSGEKRTYRLVPDNTANGLWISPFAVTVAELRSLLQGGPGRQVAAIRFKGGLVSRLSSPIVVSWSRMTPRGRE